MPRPPRYQAPDTLYHVTGHSTARCELFEDDRDRRRFLVILESVVRRYEWTFFAGVLMGTHDHLMFRTKHANIAAGMQELNSRYAQEFNAEHKRLGALFRRRYHSVVINEPGHLLWCVRYFARNPCEAGLCSSPLDWTWSSYPGLVGACPPWSFVANDEVLGLFGSDRASATSRLRDFVEAREAWG